MNKIAYISVPLWQGAGRKGSDLAPQSLIEGGVADVILPYFDIDFIQLPRIEEKCNAQNQFRLLARYLQGLKNVVSTCFTQSQLPFVVGGDHALGLGSVAAASEKYDNLGVIWFDAHGDMNTEATSPTGHIHGMPIAALLGLCSSELNDVTGRYLKPENIFWIGARSLDPSEIELIERLHLHVYSTDVVKERGMSVIMAEVQTLLHRQSIKHLHCSIDIDALDPTIVFATGVREPNGMQTKDYQQFVDELSTLPVKLTSIDFVEYNPLLDDAEKSIRQWCIDAIEHLIKAISIS